jgi:ornithine decarboxylase
MTVFTEGGESTPAVFAGPTCDSVDRFGDQESLPELSLGDVIVIHEIGAYSIATACHFNGVAPPVIIDLEDTSEVQRRQA